MIDQEEGRVMIDQEKGRVMIDQEVGPGHDQLGRGLIDRGRGAHDRQELRGRETIGGCRPRMVVLS